MKPRGAFTKGRKAYEKALAKVLPRDVRVWVRITKKQQVMRRRECQQDVVITGMCMRWESSAAGWLPGFSSLHIVHGFILSFLSANGAPNSQCTYGLEEQLWLFCLEVGTHLVKGKIRGTHGRRGRRWCLCSL